MKNSEFVVWLQGYVELCGEDALDVPKLRVIRNHLNLCRAVEGELSPHNRALRERISPFIDEALPSPPTLAREFHEGIVALGLANFPGGYLQADG